MGHHQLDSLDEQILKLIAGNARIPFLEVARACNVSGAAIHQRIQKLTNLGILKGSEYVLDPEKRNINFGEKKTMLISSQKIKIFLELFSPKTKTKKYIKYCLYIFQKFIFF